MKTQWNFTQNQIKGYDTKRNENPVAEFKGLN